MTNTIIVADEDLTVKKEIKERLEREGFKIVEAEDGDIALDYALEFNPCLIIAEVDIPVMDGWSLCANKINYEELSAVPIILMGPFREIRDRVRAIELEVDDYISKPLEMDDLVARVYLALKKAKEKHKAKEQRIQDIRLEGDLTIMPISDLVQHLNNCKKSGLLSITRKKGRKGKLYFRNGNIVHAELDSLSGSKVLLRILSWAEGLFHFEEKQPTCPQTIYANIMTLLMESMRMSDEMEAIKKDLPPFEQPLYIEFSKEFFKWGLVNAHPNQIKLLSLLNRYHSLQKVMNHTDMEDLVIAKESVNLLREGFIYAAN